MPVEPESLSSVTIGSVLMHDRPCISCGYNLKGLDTRGNCPECGTPVSAGNRKKGRFIDNFAEAPIEVIKAITLGLGLMTTSLVIGVVLIVSEVFAGGLVNALGGYAGPIAAMIRAALWVGGVVVVTARRPAKCREVPDPLLDDDRLRLAVRLCSLIAPATAMFDLVSATGIPFVGAIGYVFSAIELLSLVVLGVYLTALADWMGESGIGQRLRGASWALAILGPVTAAMIGIGVLGIPVYSGIAFVIGIITSLGSMIGLVMLSWSVFQLFNGASWALNNWHETKARQIRLANMRRERAEADARKQARPEDMPVPMPTPVPFGEDPAEFDAPIPLSGRDETEDEDEAIPLAGGDQAGSDAGPEAASSKIVPPKNSISRPRTRPDEPRPGASGDAGL